MRHACFLTALLLAGLTLVVSGQPLPAQTHGPLSVHPENPRYFADRSGKAILLTGSHTWPNVVDMGPSDPPPAFDFDAYLKWLQEHGHNFTRGWTWEPTKCDNTQMKNPEWRNGVHTVAPHPWPRTGPGPALDGKMNETHPSSTEWQYYVIRYVKQLESSLPKQHPIGMTYQNRRGKNQTLLDSLADWISPNSEGGFRDHPPDANGTKVVLSDTDHLWGVGGDAIWVWKTFTRGLNPIFMDKGVEADEITFRPGILPSPSTRDGIE